MNDGINMGILNLRGLPTYGGSMRKHAELRKTAIKNDILTDAMSAGFIPRWLKESPSNKIEDVVPEGSPLIDIVNTEEFKNLKVPNVLNVYDSKRPVKFENKYSFKDFVKQFSDKFSEKYNITDKDGNIIEKASIYYPGSNKLYNLGKIGNKPVQITENIIDHICGTRFSGHNENHSDAYNFKNFYNLLTNVLQGDSSGNIKDIEKINIFEHTIANYKLQEILDELKTNNPEKIITKEDILNYIKNDNNVYKNTNSCIVINTDDKNCIMLPIKKTENGLIQPATMFDTTSKRVSSLQERNRLIGKRDAEFIKKFFS